MKPFEGPFDFDAAAHLWRRAGFGATPSKIAETAKLSPAEAAKDPHAQANAPASSGDRKSVV